jgi:outer membrane protein assembly factor BamC
MKQSVKDLFRRAALIGVALPALCLLSACSSGLLDSKTIEYKSASNKSLPPLELPPGLSTPRTDDRFALPDGTSAAPSTTLSVYNAERSGQNRQAAGSTNLLPDVAKVRIERSGSQRWLVVPEIPEKVWPTVKEFWQESGFLVNLELLEAGVMETDWAENRAKIPQDALRNLLGKVLDGMYSTSERDKFRTRLERGTEAGTTEIYISHRGVQEVFTNQRQERSVWQPRPSDPELEAEFLRRLIDQQEAEKQTLCNDFHDGLIQHVVGSKMLLEARLHGSPEDESMHEIIQHLSKGIVQSTLSPTIYEPQNYERLLVPIILILAATKKSKY